MEWQGIAATTSVLALVATLITFIFQLRVQIRHLKARVSADLTVALNDYNKVEIDHPRLRDIYCEEFEKTDRSDHDVRRAELLIDMRFVVYEEAYAQYRKYGLMDYEDWIVWFKLIAKWASRPFFAGYWAENREIYDRDFARVVDKLIKENESDPGANPL